MYAICRIKKLKNFANVGGANNHNLRLEETLNADPDKLDDNVHLGPTDPVAKIKEIHEFHGIKPRKNAVIANEYLLTASPEFFEGMTTKEVKRWAQRNLDWLKEKHASGLVSFTLHLDEGTPHIHAIVTPIYENKKGEMKLAAKHFFDKPMLKKMQTDYADLMKPFGLQRGIENSRAKHQEIRKYYGELESELAKATKEAKSAVSEFKEFKGQEPRFYNIKKMYKKAAELIENFANKYIEMKRINAAMMHKFDSKIERLETQMTVFKQDSEKLHELYELTGCVSTLEAFKHIKSATLVDAEKRKLEASKHDRDREYQKLISDFDGPSPAALMSEAVHDKSVNVKRTRNLTRENDSPSLG